MTITEEEKIKAWKIIDKYNNEKWTKEELEFNIRIKSIIGKYYRKIKTSKMFSNNAEFIFKITGISDFKNHRLNIIKIDAYDSFDEIEIKHDTISYHDLKHYSEITEKEFNEILYNILENESIIKKLFQGVIGHD